MEKLFYHWIPREIILKIFGMFKESASRHICQDILVDLTKREMRTLVWLAGWEESTVVNVVSAIRKAIAAEAGRQEQPLRP